MQPRQVALKTRSRQSPFASPNVQQQTKVAQYLKLLANLIFDVPIIRMKLFQFTLEGVGVGGGEVRFAEAADGVQHVQRPAAFSDADFF